MGGFLESLIKEEAEKNANDNRKYELTDNIIAVTKLIYTNITVEEIAETLALSPTHIESTKE